MLLQFLLRKLRKLASSNISFKSLDQIYGLGGLSGRYGSGRPFCVWEELAGMLSLFQKSEKDTEYNSYIFWGLASMWKASAFYVGAGDAIFSPVRSGKPVESILLSIVSRALFGLITGLLYRMAKRSRHPVTGIVIVSSIGRSLHTFCVYLFMQFLFPEAGFTVLNTLKDSARWDYLPFLLITDVLIVFCYELYRSEYVTNFFLCVRMVDQVNAITSHYKRRLIGMLVLVLAFSFSVAIYFTNRIRTVIARYGVEVAEEMSYDLMHLQLQFLFGMTSLAVLVIIIIILYQKHFNYLYYEAKIDGLTGVLGRQQFFQIGESLLESLSFDQNGKNACFIVLDVDEFKRINDVYGHPAGDRVLKEIAGHLKAVFEKKGIIGRLGGDEFVVFVSRPMAQKELEHSLHSVKARIGNISLEDEKITCSIGVIPAEKRYTIEELYKYADRLLYEAKKNGKDRFVLGYRFADEED